MGDRWLFGLVLVVLALCGCGPHVNAMDAAVGRLTFEEAVVEFGPPVYDRADGRTGLRMVQWISESTSLSAPGPQPGGGGFAGGMARGLAAGRPTEVDVTRRILTLWFDEQGIMRRWARAVSLR